MRFRNSEVCMELSAPMNNPMLQPTTGSQIEKIAEDLWLKGYDLQRTEFGWTVREPLGARTIQIGSDAELVDFAVGRFNSPPKQKTTERASDSSRLAQPVEMHCAPLPKKISNLISLGFQLKPKLLMIIGTTTLVILIGIGFLLKGLKSAPPESPPMNESTGKAGPHQGKPSAPTSLQSLERTWTVEPDQGTESFQVKGSILGMTQQSDRNDLTAASKLCMLQLQSRFSTGDLSLLPAPRSQSGETCYQVDGMDYCPYHSRGLAIFLYMDTQGAQTRTYGCDINVGSAKIGNLRVVNADPRIVRFLAVQSGHPMQ